MALTDKLAFCTLSDLKDDLSITDSGSDARLERRILSASELIQQYLNRPLRRQVGRVEALPGFGTALLLPELTPIESVASLSYDGSLVDEEEYSVTEDGLFIRHARGGVWRDTALTEQTIAREPQRLGGTEQPLYELTYTGGYYLPNDTLQAGTPLPQVIVEACLMTAASLHQGRGRDGAVQSESVGGASVQMRVAYAGDGQAGGLSAQVVRMLSGFKRAV